MFWLLVIGAVHSLFWWGDVLNFYAISGALLLLFRKCPTSYLLAASFMLMFILTPFISCLLHE
jgi:uncharacterized protein